MENVIFSVLFYLIILQKGKKMLILHENII